MKIFGTVKLTYMHAYSIYTPGPENVSLLAKVANELSLNARMHFSTHLGFDLACSTENSGGLAIEREKAT